MLQIYYRGCGHERIVEHPQIQCNLDSMNQCDDCLNTPKTNEELIAWYIDGLRRHAETQKQMGGRVAIDAQNVLNFLDSIPNP